MIESGFPDTIVSLLREQFYDIPVKNRLVYATAYSFRPDRPASVTTPYDMVHK